MPSPSAWRWLLKKEWRELMSSRSWWVMLALIGPLVGVSFISAVRSYAEASGQGGTAAGLADGLLPLDGVVAPTFSAYEIAASFLLPFVAIRAIAGDRTSGALKLELQQGMTPLSMIGAKALVLGVGWLLAGVPIVLAGILWVSYGGSLYAPEIGSLTLGHLLNAGMVIALAAAAASLAEHPSTAAFQGGIWEEIAGYTPSEMLQAFRRGLVRLDLMLAALVLIAAALVLAAVWMRLGVPTRRKVTESIAILSVTAALAFAASLARPSWDVSENERNSFAEPEAAILAKITLPLTIEVHLAPEDPRRFDLEKQTLSKLRRTMRNVTVAYVSGSAIGLFEQASEHYGEIWYDLGGQRIVGRAATTDGVLASARRTASRRHACVLRRLAAHRAWPRTFVAKEEIVMKELSRRDLMSVAAGCATAPLWTRRLSAAELRVDLSNERVAQPPTTFQPIVGTWRVVQDGAEKVIMVDGQPWKANQNNRTALLAERARSFYNASQEDFIDNVKQFAYYPIATLNGVDNFSNGAISLKFKTIAGDLDRCSGILFNVKPNGDWLSTRYNDTEYNITLWTFRDGIRKMVRRGPGREPWHLARDQWHDLKMTVAGTEFRTYINGQLALEYTLPEPVSGKIGLWSKTDSTSYFKDYVVESA